MRGGDNVPFSRYFLDDPINKNWCRVYGRDRGKDDTDARIVENEEKFLQEDRWQDYFYLFKNNQWYYCPADESFKKLTVKACKEA